MIVKDLFDLSTALIKQISYMTENYTETSEELDEIPDKTLDDIIEEIKEENTEGPTDTDDNTEEASSDETVETKVNPMDAYIKKCNIIIVQANSLRNNAVMDNIMNTDVLIPQDNVISICGDLSLLIHDLYDITKSVRDIFNSSDNTNSRSIFIIDAYNALVSITEVITAIYNELNSREYLKSINGPVQSDYDHWINEEVSTYLTSLDTWKNADDDKKISLIDESVQLVLKYSALLKKLVISEFKGFDDYYTKLIDYIIRMNDILNYYAPEDGDGYYNTEGSPLLDPSLFAKLNKLSTIMKGYIPAKEE